MTAPMPKDNEVDEKAVAFAMTDHQDDGPMTILTTDRKYAECWAAEGIQVEPLYSAATVAELLAEVASSKLQGELAALEQFLRMASEPVGQECCGQGYYQCCGNPIPVFAQPNEVFQAMSDRHAEIFASLATLPGADPT